jgi:hypothetical protein
MVFKRRNINGRSLNAKSTVERRGVVSPASRAEVACVVTPAAGRPVLTPRLDPVYTQSWYSNSVRLYSTHSGRAGSGGGGVGTYFLNISQPQFKGSFL